MKNAHVEVARNVVNTEQIDEYLSEQVGQHPTLEVWITKVLRKWLLTKAPTAKVEGMAQEGVPEWLKKAMETNTAEEVVLNGELTNMLIPIFDYLENLVAEKPNQDQTRIAFDQAVAGSKKWHEQMAKKAARAKPIEEDGTKVIHTFPNGWYWVNVFGKNSMKREGDMMGHCVGQSAAFMRAVGQQQTYFTQSLAGRKEIYSLRDPKNEPHCTIEINNLHGNRAINQIKGKANREVKEEYLPMVEAFLKQMKWDTVNFDGARLLSDKIIEHRGGDAFKGPHGYLITRDITHYYSEKTFYTIKSPNGEERRYGAYDFGSMSAAAASDFLDYLLQNKIYMTDKEIAHNHAYQRGRWTQEQIDDIGYMLKPNDDFARIFSKSISRGDDKAALLVHIDSSLIGYATSDIALTEEFAGSKQVFPFLEKMVSIPNATVFELSSKESGAPVKNTKLTDFYRHRHAGASVARNGDSKQILDSFLVAMRLPDVSVIKHATVALRGKEISDADVKHAGIPTGGNSTMAYPLVLAMSALGNKPDALTYICSKPHALRNWLEVMNNGMAAFLDRMKFTDDIKQRIHSILYNEYVRLVPTPTELANLDISVSDKKAIAEASKGMKRNDPQASKQLWA